MHEFARMSCVRNNEDEDEEEEKEKDEFRVFVGEDYGLKIPFV